MTQSTRYRYDEVLARIGLAVPVIGAEVGVAWGLMSGKLLEAPLLTLYMVDHWGGNVGLQKHARHATSFAGDRARVMMMRSLEAAPMFADGYFDFVFIDADHSRPAVEADIRAWAPKVRSGGWLCGHDYGKGHTPGNGTCWGVDLAVDDFAKAPGLVLETGEDYTWFVRLP